ncbi:MAG: hypothetical protein XD76_0276 [candidate division TA06 bacterium 32_111]|uniref:Lipoprotein n=1 Tax=candidate division TA06 bacterium 34_109 TaxID=1635277 RepID=A0A101I2S2_UNCT6|nr:MAG: hypothetical protein XD76_0276 [candidate division TA06 bacterium 32_111]KUK87691.1 MAG: hypothetical protein XE03_0582 [candidate division TA06 bacterium 34_109]
MIKKILFLGVIFSLILTSCFLLPQEVSVDDTKTFLNVLKIPSTIQPPSTMEKIQL